MLLICYIYIKQYHYYYLYQCSTGQMPLNYAPLQVKKS